MIDEELSKLYFKCNSGEMLWGQFHTILEGYLSTGYDVPNEIPETLKGGTIIQRNYKYKIKAEKGIWKISSILLKSNIKHNFKTTGYIIYNCEVDPVDIVRRCSKVGRSLNNDHLDDKIIYINRYDWSNHHRARDKIEKKIENLLGGKDEKQKIESLFHGRIILVDKESTLEIIDQLKEYHEEIEFGEPNSIINKVLKTNERHVGVHLNLSDVEYEYGWLVYNNNNNLIAIVYDGMETILEGELKVNNKIAVSFKEYMKIIEKREENEKKIFKIFEIYDEIYDKLENKERIDIENILYNSENKNANIIIDKLINLGFSCFSIKM